MAFYFWPISLDDIHSKIERDYDSVLHVNTLEFDKIDPDQLVVFDVREKEEYRVSHIEGAIQLSPNISPDEFEEQFGALIEGQQIVFYCSVGRRSSAVASRLSEVTEDLGAVSASNLTGGVFNWVNEDRQLSGSKVHPYSEYWGRLIDDKTKISFSSSR